MQHDSQQARHGGQSTHQQDDGHHDLMSGAAAPDDMKSARPSAELAPSTAYQGRDRTRSFLGLGFGSSNATLSEAEGSGGSARRKISFGPLGPAQGGVASPSNHPANQAPAVQAGASRKSTSGAKAFIRRAKSFGTSPLLGSSSDGGFGSANPSPAPSALPSPAAMPQPLPPTESSAPSPFLGSTADWYGPVQSPMPFSPSSTTTSFAPASPYFHADSRASTSSMLLSEALPSQPPWLLAPATTTESASPGASSGGRSSSERGRGRRSADSERRRPSEGAETSRGATLKKGKGKAVDSASTTPKRKPRRATLGSLFGRKDSKTSAVADPLPTHPSAAGSEPLSGGRQVHDSPQEGDASSFPGPAPSSIPSLPSLPSLHFSKDPYRMSWGFSHTSPASSPEKRREPRPRVSISTTPVDGSPGPASPVVALTPAEEPPDTDKTVILLPANGGQALPVPPPMQHQPSNDSALTLQIRMPNASTASDTLESAREELKASSPPALRQRSNSYGFPNPNSPRLAYIPGGSSAPLTPSPLASPSNEQENPLTGSTSTIVATAANGGPSATSPSSSGPSLARTLIKTRAARSYSDASDRRSPATADSLLSSAGRAPTLPPSRTSTSSLGGLPPAVQRGNLARPATADNATTTTRSSVFGSIGSFFSGGGSGGGSGSHAMSRSASAATSTGSVQAPSASPSLTDDVREVNEFGALFDGSDRRSSSLARSNTNRKRGLSVGGGGGAGGGGGSLGFFGSSGSSSSLIPPASSSNGAGSIQNRARSGSASSANTSASGTGSGPLNDTLVVPSSFGSVGSGSLGGRMRALTDPNRRFSFAIPGGGGGGNDSPAASPSRGANRPRGSSLSAVQSTPYVMPVRKKPRKAPPPRETETPEAYVVRLLEGTPKRARWDEQEARESTESLVGSQRSPTIEEQAEEDTTPMPKGELTRILSASADPFYAQALRAFLRLFPFEELALDVALRVFLCSASLPTETQQIDRVMEAFARRYCECNPGLFGNLPRKRDVGEEGLSTEGTEENRAGAIGGKREGKEESDIPYVLAFSMVMLNTDHFNPNAKMKMTKADYVRNTRMDGVSAEVLEYLYDQITLAPFIYVDDHADSTSPSLRAPSPHAQLGQSLGPSASSSSFVSTSGSMTGQTFLSAGTTSKSKVDPYQLIASGQTRRFRIDVESMVPPRSPFSFTGTTAFFDTSYLHSLFAHAPVLQITNRSRAGSRSQGVGSPPMSANAYAVETESPNPSVFGSPLLPTMSNSTFVDPPKKKDRPPISSLKITKVGLLSRKEDLVEGGRKAPSRKWRGWSVVLTGSQLLFFKDPHFASSLQSALDRAAAAAQPRSDGHVLAFSYPGSFKPDAVLSLAHSVAIFDASYAKYSNVFRLIAPAGRQYLFQAHDGDELNSWVHAINFAASFKSAGIKIRPLSPAFPGQSDLHRSTPPSNSPRSSLGASVPAPGASRLVRSQGQDSLTASVGPSSSRRSVSPRRPTSPAGQNARLRAPGQSVDGSNSATADDRGGLPSLSLLNPVTLSQVLDASPAQVAAPAPLTARAESLRTKIGELDAIIRTTKENLQADLRIAKHLAVLTPFRTSTRERILAALPPIEKRVRHHRMQLAKFVGYREVLSRDLLVEDRESERLMRKHSVHRTHSRRTSSVPRQRSHATLYSGNSSLHARAQDDLARSSNSRLRPPTMATSEVDLSPRHSFESGADSLSAAEDPLNGAQHSLTDDELDRVRTRAAPPMQRSKTESDWEHAGPFQGPLRLPHIGAMTERDADGRASTPGEDELEERVADIERLTQRDSRAGSVGGGTVDDAPLVSPLERDFGRFCSAAEQV